MTSFHDPKIREKVISDLEQTIIQQQRQLNNEARKQQQPDDCELPGDENKNKKRQQKNDASSISSITSSVRNWKTTSWVFRIANTMSGWFLLAILLFLMSWARHSMEPISHLVGYQLI